MDWQTVGLLGALLFVVTLAVLRSVPRLRRVIILVLPLPAGFLVYRWAAYRGAWRELGLAAALGLAALGLWWWAVGRRLPPPGESPIRVWTKDDPF